MPIGQVVAGEEAPFWAWWEQLTIPGTPRTDWVQCENPSWCNWMPFSDFDKRCQPLNKAEQVFCQQMEFGPELTLESRQEAIERGRESVAHFFPPPPVTFLEEKGIQGGLLIAALAIGTILVLKAF